MAPLATSTIKAASASHARYASAKWSAPSTQEQNKQKKEEQNRLQAEMDNIVQEWFTASFQKADELAERFNKKPRIFLDWFFTGGVRMLNHHSKTNPFNAFIGVKSQALRDEGCIESVLSIQNEFKHEYEVLTPQEREAIVQEFKENVQVDKKIRRPAPRARIQDFANTVRNIRLLIEALKLRIGVEGFFCIVHNTTEYHVKPQWYFSSKQLADYMKLAVGKKWDDHNVGTKLEAFAIAGCDPINLKTTSKQKADYIRNEIRDRISSMLVEITKNPKAVMQYTNYEEAIVLRYGIELQGWTYENFVNPSELSTSLPPLKALLLAIDSGTCKFVCLTASERSEREAAYLAKINSGEVEPKKRKRRKDAGTTRAKRARVSSKKNQQASDSEEEDSADDKVEEHAAGRYKSSELVNDD